MEMERGGEGERGRGGGGEEGEEGDKVRRAGERARMVGQTKSEASGVRKHRGRGQVAVVSHLCCEAIFARNLTTTQKLIPRS